MYTAYYIEREDGAADLCAVVETGEIISEDLIDDIVDSLGETLAMSSQQWFVVEGDNNNFPNIWNKSPHQSSDPVPPPAKPQRYGVSQFDGSTFVVFDSSRRREVCVCSDYDPIEDAEKRAKKIAILLNLADGLSVI